MKGNCKRRNAVNLVRIRWVYETKSMNNSNWICSGSTYPGHNYAICLISWCRTICCSGLDNSLTNCKVMFFSSQLKLRQIGATILNMKLPCTIATRLIHKSLTLMHKNWDNPLFSTTASVQVIRLNGQPFVMSFKIAMDCEKLGQ